MHGWYKSGGVEDSCALCNDLDCVAEIDDVFGECDGVTVVGSVVFESVSVRLARFLHGEADSECAVVLHSSVLSIFDLGVEIIGAKHNLE